MTWQWIYHPGARLNNFSKVLRKLPMEMGANSFANLLATSFFNSREPFLKLFPLFLMFLLKGFLKIRFDDLQGNFFQSFLFQVQKFLVGLVLGGHDTPFDSFG